ncbi:MAG TPA: disulfide bond formation protein B [Candidatus Paceibacterota bacterium]|nr:disulfide bond formation protein B [Candidatus Paceibacterota bacterium]
MGLFVTNLYLGYAALGLQIATIALLAVFVVRARFETFTKLATIVGRWGLWLGFAAALFAALANQYYNQVLEIPPCDLCWWGRIFLYPQIILLGMAAWKRDSYMAEYSIVLSVIGAGISLYHHFLQMFPDSLPCPATGVSCAQRFLFEFGYITYPLMAFSLFAFLIIVMLFVRARRGM